MCSSDLKIVVTVKISAHSELQNRNEKSNHAQIRAEIKSPNAKSNFFKPKWVKLGTLLKITEKKLSLLLQQEDTKKIKNKNNRVASRKALSL